LNEKDIKDQNVFTYIMQPDIYFGLIEKEDGIYLAMIWIIIYYDKEKK